MEKGRGHFNPDDAMMKIGARHTRVTQERRAKGRPEHVQKQVNKSRRKDAYRDLKKDVNDTLDNAANAVVNIFRN